MMKEMADPIKINQSTTWTKVAEALPQVESPLKLFKSNLMHESFKAT